MTLTDRLKLLVIDFDGTALGGYDPYGRFSDNLSWFLAEIASRGVQWATCTTWHPYTQDKVFARSMVRSRPARLIGRTSLNCGHYVNGELYLDAAWDHEMIGREMEFVTKHLPAVRKFIGSAEEIISYEEIFDYIFCIQCKDRSRLLRHFRSNDIMCEKTYVVPIDNGESVQVFPYYMSKGFALAKLHDQLGIPSEQTMVAADGENDLPMLRKDLAAMQIAPANAVGEVQETVKRNGGIVSSLRYSDGVVDAARKLLSGA